MTEAPHPTNVIPLRPTTARLTALEQENAQLRAARDSRLVIEQAKVALGARLGTTPEVAFEMIRGLARSQHRNLHAFAAEIVANGGRLG